MAGMIAQEQTCRTRAPVDNVLVAPVEDYMDSTVLLESALRCRKERHRIASAGLQTTHLRSSLLVSRYQSRYTCTKH